MIALSVSSSVQSRIAVETSGDNRGPQRKRIVLSLLAWMQSIEHEMASGGSDQRLHRRSHHAKLLLVFEVVAEERNLGDVI